VAYHKQISLYYSYLLTCLCHDYGSCSNISGINPLLVQFKILLHGQKGCVFSAGI